MREGTYYSEVYSKYAYVYYRLDTSDKCHFCGKYVKDPIHFVWEVDFEDALENTCDTECFKQFKFKFVE